MNNYETVFILTPVLSDTQVEEAVKKFTDFLKEKGAEMVHQENWGLRKLAYPIQLKRNGFYHLMEYKAAGDMIAELELLFKRDERVIRFLTVKLDKHGIDWANQRRENKKASSNN